MVHELVGTVVISLVYLCLIIVVFSPTLYTAWLYLLGRRVSAKTRGLLRLMVSTFVINAIVAYFLAQFAYDYVLASKMAEWQGLATTSIHNAVASQQKFFRTHGKYYSVGPVRGPYKDDHGLRVEKDVILQVIPEWDKNSHTETFQAYAVHVLTRSLLRATQDGKIEQAPPDSDESSRIKRKLFRSVK